MRRAIETTYRAARRIVVGLIGATVICVGILLIVLPGPAIIVIPMGLGILGLEFAWARRWLRNARERAQTLVRTGRRAVDPAPELGADGRSATTSTCRTSKSVASR